MKVSPLYKLPDGTIAWTHENGDVYLTCPRGMKSIKSSSWNYAKCLNIRNGNKYLVRDGKRYLIQSVSN